MLDAFLTTGSSPPARDRSPAARVLVRVPTPQLVRPRREPSPTVEAHELCEYGSFQRVNIVDRMKGGFLRHALVRNDVAVENNVNVIVLWCPSLEDEPVWCGPPNLNVVSEAVMHLYVCVNGVLTEHTTALAELTYKPHGRRFLHRESAAFRASSRRSSAVSVAMRARPPLRPPFRPRATACGFFFLAMRASLPSASPRWQALLTTRSLWHNIPVRRAGHDGPHSEEGVPMLLTDVEELAKKAELLVWAIRGVMETARESHVDADRLGPVDDLATDLARGLRVMVHGA